MFSVIVPVLHNFEGCCKLLSSINEPFVPVVIDNWVENRGVAAAWNLGIYKSMQMGIDRFVIMNDDAYFANGSKPSELLAALNDNTAIAMPDAEIGFACFALDKHTVDKVGFFDESYTPAYFEDNDYIYRVKMAGLRYSFTDSSVVHEGSKTQFWKGDGDDERIVSHEQFRSNRAYYVKKWGGQPGEETYTVPFDNKQPAPIYHQSSYTRSR